MAPWEDYTEELLREDVERSTITIAVPDLETRVAIARELRYRKRFIGRGLIRAVASVPALRVGDRLEPSEALPDVSQFEVQAPPFNAVFWRMDSDDRVLHDSPLFTVPGLSVQTHGCDTLHCWALGPVCAFVSTALWYLLGTSVFAINIDGLAAEDCMRISLTRVKQRLFDHYKIKRGDERWRKKGSEVWNLTLKMLGSKKRPMMSVKAAEAKGLLEFAVKLLGESLPKLAAGDPKRDTGEMLLASGAAAQRVEELLRNDGTETVAPAKQQELLNYYMRHFTLFHRAGGKLYPKHHMMFHLIINCGRMGAPSLHATFRDESMNGVIARIARSCHRNHFGEVVHYKFNALQQMVGLAAQHMH